MLIFYTFKFYSLKVIKMINNLAVKYIIFLERELIAIILIVSGQYVGSNIMHLHVCI